MSSSSISKLLEQGESLRRAISRSIAEDEVLLNSDIVTRDVDPVNQKIQPDQIIDYLLGQKMTTDEENRVLKELMDLPHLENIIETTNPRSEISSTLEHAINLRREISSTSEQAAATNVTEVSRTSILDSNSVLRLKISMLELNDTGMKSLTSPRYTTHTEHSHVPPSFLVEYLPPRACPGQQHLAVRLCSKRVSGKGITFGQEKLHSCESASKPIIFNIYFRHANQTSATLLGKADFNWDVLIHSPALSCELKLPVYHHTKYTNLGRLHLSVQLENENSSSSVIMMKSQKMQDKRIGQKPQTVSQIDTLLEYERQVPQPHQEKAILLRNLIHITQSKEFDENLSHLYLILKSFWIEDALKSNVCWKSQNPCFNFHENLPVLISPYFLDRCRGNHAVLEVWDANQAGDTLVGIAKLSLQTFYLAFRYAEISQELLAAKSPVISVDHWVPIIHPVSGTQAGEILVLLAMGTDEQVSRLERKRNLRRKSLNDSDALQTAASASPLRMVSTKQNLVNHRLKINILKISNFPLMESFSHGEADCFIDYKLPVYTLSGITYKSYISDMSLCTIEPRFTSQHVHVSTQPMSKLIKEGYEVTFRVWCRIYMPYVNDIVVAQACLPKSSLIQLEEKSKMMKNTSNIKVSLPLTIKPLPDILKICSNLVNAGHLTLELFYTEIQNSDKTEEKLPEVKGTQTTLELNDFVEVQADIINIASDEESSVSADVSDEQGSDDDSDLAELLPKIADISLAHETDETLAKEYYPMVNPSDLPDMHRQPTEKSSPLSNETDYIYPPINYSDVTEISAKGLSIDDINSNIEVHSAIALQTSILNIQVKELYKQLNDVNLPKSNASSSSEQEILNNYVLMPHVDRHSPDVIDLIENEDICDSNEELDCKSSDSNDSSPELNVPPTFFIHVEVKEASRLPSLNATLYGIMISPPTTYVSIQGKSPDDIVIGPIVRNSCEPCWDWHCNVNIPTQLLLQPNQHLIVKLWHPCNIEDGANPAKDSILCFAAIGLSGLLTGLPQISGWYNLLNFAGQSCGEIKVCVTPLESLAPFLHLKQSFKAQPQNSSATLYPAHSTQQREQSPPPVQLLEETDETGNKDFELPPNPFIDLTSSAIETKLHEQILDLDALSSELMEKIKDLNIDATEDGEVAVDHSVPKDVPSSGESDNESTSATSVDSDVAKLLANFDLETLHKLVEQLDDEREKLGRCSKPDFVCKSSQTSLTPRNTEDKPEASLQPATDVASTSRQTPEGGSPIDKSSILPDTTKDDNNSGILSEDAAAS